MESSSATSPRLSIVVPIYNEEATLPELYRRTREVLAGCPGEHEILFVNDASTDGSMATLLELHRSDPALKVIEFSRNFGQQMALSAGIDHASGEAVILMDGDLQDPPEFIPQLVERWRAGYEVVYAIRTKRKESFLKRLAFASFYRLLKQLSGTPVPVDAGIFSLMDRKVVDVMRSMPERNRYLSGLRAWAGFRQVGIPCERGHRYAEEPRVTLTRLVKLAADGVFSFSYVPLRAAMVVGALFSMASFLVGLNALYQKLFTSKAILGWASTLAAVTFTGGLILLVLGIIGEYLARIYDEVKQRPRYVVGRTVGL